MPCSEQKVDVRHKIPIRNNDLERVEVGVKNDWNIGRNHRNRF